MPDTRGSDLSPITSVARLDRFFMLQESGGSFSNKTSAFDILARDIDKSVKVHLMSGSDMGTKVANAIAALPSTGGLVDARGLEGSQTWGSAISIAKPIAILLGQSDILAGSMFNFTGSGEVPFHLIGRRGQSKITATTSFTGDIVNIDGPSHFSEVRDISFVCDNAPAATCVKLDDNVVGCRVKNLYATYPTNGSGSIVHVENASLPHIKGIAGNYPGTGIHVNADNGSEITIEDTDIHNASLGIWIKRLTNNSVGGVYIYKARIANPASRATSQGIKISAANPGEGVPTIVDAVMIDNSRGGDSLEITNTDNCQLSNTWVHNGASVGDNRAALRLDGVTNLTFQGGGIYSSGYGVRFLNTISGLQLTGAQFSAATEFFFDTGYTFGALGAVIEPNVCAFSTNDAAKLNKMRAFGRRLLVLTTTERDNISSPPEVPILNSTTGKLNFYAAGSWREVTST